VASSNSFSSVISFCVGGFSIFASNFSSSFGFSSTTFAAVGVTTAAASGTSLFDSPAQKSSFGSAAAAAAFSAASASALHN
jgi:hypothetical protein